MFVCLCLFVCLVGCLLVVCRLSVSCLLVVVVVVCCWCWLLLWLLLWLWLWLLVVGRWLLFVVFVVCCLLFVVCCLLFVVCCLLFVVCCLLLWLFLTTLDNECKSTSVGLIVTTPAVAQHRGLVWASAPLALNVQVDGARKMLLKTARKAPRLKAAHHPRT